MKSVNKFPAKKEFQREQKKLKSKHPNKPRFRHLLKFKLNFFSPCLIYSDLFISLTRSHARSLTLSYCLFHSLLDWRLISLTSLSLSHWINLKNCQKLSTVKRVKKIKQEKSSKTKSLFLPLVTISTLISLHLWKKKWRQPFQELAGKKCCHETSRDLAEKKLAICQQLNFLEADKNNVCLCFIMTAKQSLVHGPNIK